MRKIAGAAAAFSWLAAFLMLAQVSVDILGKFLFGMPVAGTAEVVAAYYMIILVFMAFPLVEQRNEAIAVDLLYDRFGPRLKLVSRVTALVITLAFYLAFAWMTLEAALKSYQIREVVLGAREFQIWPSRFFLPIGCLLAGIVVILREFVAFREKSEVAYGSR